MSERSSYPHGVPNWVTCLATDVAQATDFYRRVFGWTFEDGGGYTLARLRDREVAGIGPVAEASDGAHPSWITEVRVDDAAETARRAERAGGRVLAGPMDLSPASLLVVLADPSGAVLCATQPVGRQGAELVNEPSAWSMSTLVVPDLGAVEGFYGELFGWQRESYGTSSLWRLPGYVGGEPTQPVPRDVVAVGVEGPGPARWDVDFWIADVEAAVAEATDAGGSVLAGPSEVPGLPFRSATLADPGGAVFSVSQLLG
ncbi:MAG: VOC family protein [Micropruina sp.]|uniref:VOC family protein n=1 Tax=Micropruina sp. TaxID=2737536 RepID=UPI0039E533E3